MAAKHIIQINDIVDALIMEHTTIGRRVELADLFNDITKNFASDDIDNHPILKEAENYIFKRFCFICQTSIPHSEFRELGNWISQNLSNLWAYDRLTVNEKTDNFEFFVWFENQNDAALFKLRWG